MLIYVLLNLLVNIGRWYFQIGIDQNYFYKLIALGKNMVDNLEFIIKHSKFRKIVFFWKLYVANAGNYFTYEFYMIINIYRFIDCYFVIISIIFYLNIFSVY